jgi:hypothetical protein
VQRSHSAPATVDCSRLLCANCVEKLCLIAAPGPDSLLLGAGDSVDDGRRAVGRGPPIELVVEDGFDGAVGPGADLDGALGGRLDARGAKGADETDDAETSAIPLLGMGPGLQDLLAKGRGRRADLAGVFPDALERVVTSTVFTAHCLVTCYPRIQ